MAPPPPLTLATRDTPTQFSALSSVQLPHGTHSTQAAFLPGRPLLLPQDLAFLISSPLHIPKQIHPKCSSLPPLPSWPRAAFSSPDSDFRLFLDPAFLSEPVFLLRGSHLTLLLLPKAASWSACPMALANRHHPSLSCTWPWAALWQDFLVGSCVSGEAGKDKQP